MLGKPNIGFKKKQKYKPTWFALFIVYLCISSYSYSQDTEDIFNRKVSLGRQRTSVYQALNQLSDSIGYFFAYDSKVVFSDKRVRFSINNLPLSIAIDQILNDSSLTYKAIDRHILIYRDPSFEIISKSEKTDDSLSHFSIKGRVLDAETRVPIAYATVGIPEYSLGNITNQDGVFLLKIPKNLNSQNVLITHIGFKSKRVPVNLLKNDMIDIYLSTDYISIQEVIIRNIDPRSIVQEAFSKINQNYSNTPLYLNSFYREGVIKNNKYQNYSEAIFKIYKSSYTSRYDNDLVKLQKSRKHQNLELTDTLSIKLRGGAHSSLALDIAKSPPFFFSNDYWNLFNFTRKDIVTIGDKTAYAIAFEQRESVIEPLYMGVLYIEMETLAILGAEFEVNPKYISLVTDQYVVKRNRHFRIRPQRIKYSIQYNLFDGKYYLSHVRGDLYFKYRQRRSLFYNPFHLFFELMVSSVDNNNVTKFDRREVEPIANVFFDNSYEKDHEFWYDFNIIPPEQSIFDALNQINSKVEEIIHKN